VGLGLLLLRTDSRQEGLTCTWLRLENGGTISQVIYTEDVLPGRLGKVRQEDPHGFDILLGGSVELAAQLKGSHFVERRGQVVCSRQLKGAARPDSAFYVTPALAPPDLNFEFPFYHR